MVLKGLFFIAATLSIHDAIADDDVIHPQTKSALETVTVTATFAGIDPATYGGSTISAADLARTLPFSSIEVLNQQAGITAFQKGGEGGSSYLSVRGGEPNYTLVLLDGIKLNDPTNSQGGSFDLNQLDPSVLERIDVYRGALSAVHGSDALAGIINLQLRSIDTDQLLASSRAQLDTEHGWGINGSFGLGWREGGFLTSVTRSDSGDVSEGSTRQRWQALARVDETVDAAQLDVTVLHADSQRRDFPEDSGGSRLAVNRELERVNGVMDALALSIAASNPGRIQPQLKVSWTKQTADATTPAIYPGVLDYVPPITADTNFQRRDVLGDVSVVANQWLTATAGGEWTKERGVSRGTIDYGVVIPADFDIERTTKSVFAELIARPSAAAVLTVGTRYDDPSSQAARWTSRVSLNYRPVDRGPSVYANWSQGYKLPSLYALAYPLIANPTLRPERSRSIELGVQRSGNATTSYRFGYFHTRFVDMIDFDSTLFTNVNRSWVVTRGFEAEVAQPLSDSISLQATATFMDTDAINNGQLRARPRWHSDATLTWQASPQWALWSHANYTAHYYDSSVPTGVVQVAGHITTDIGAEFHFSKHWNTALVLKNVFDKQYEETVGTPSSGRLLRLGVTFSM